MQNRNIYPQLSNKQYHILNKLYINAHTHTHTLIYLSGGHNDFSTKLEPKTFQKSEPNCTNLIELAENQFIIYH